MSSKIILRRDTGTNWGSVNPILANGELGFETDTRRFKLGNGTSTWSALSYALNTLMYGTIDPVSGLGLNGDFYINTAALTIFGPKAAGTWPVGASIKGLGITPQALGFTLTGGTTSKTLTVDASIATSAIATKTGAEELTNKQLTTPAINGYVEGSSTVSASTALTLDITSSTYIVVTLTGNVPYTFPTPAVGKSFQLTQKQDATGNRLPSFPANVKWPGDVTPTITATANKKDRFGFSSDGTYWYGSVMGSNYS